ncbi:alpha/beta fold hydrolase [Pseudomaricurvus alkylphenolicus]|uniref:PHA/PHB synthase family protein n=1 Tax=Pseudomaricurvus alkylphenolicus TaxID=1306991 RepID=UPI001423A6A4|nr:alpha/beta fold hydrolase [Pseudomaricurvus alkylphenolicus]NIB43646.1 alpha/beta fold hydrolase [Pseudomaricurvus alkylphenolicus]
MSTSNTADQNLFDNSLFDSDNPFASLFSKWTDSSGWDSQRLDDEFKGAIAKAFKGTSPLEMALAYLDWVSHLAISPGKQLTLVQSFFKGLSQICVYGMQAAVNPDTQAPMTTERKYSGEEWQKWPFNVLAQLHQLQKAWLREATTDVEGITGKHEQLVQFMATEFMAAISPSNFPLTNPDVIKATMEEGGMNLVRGWKNFMSDTFGKALGQEPPKSDFVVGENVGVTPGKVIYQNDLLELIQYQPATEDVGAEPVFIVPPWIMKYYILDLSPKNSMVKYLVEQGKTVFLISWKNPGEEDRDVSFMDYLNHGLFEAMAAANAVCPNRKLNAVGYCLGGTILSIAAALMAREEDDRLNSITLFASQVDFSEAGEITQFISESQLMFLEKLMWKQGYLGIENMGGAFAHLRVDDLVFGPAVDRYLLGKDMKLNDLMAWNADGTRMPYKMHSEYLRSMYLNNELSTNNFKVNGKNISLADIRVPVFNVGTETDHVAPWASVYKINHLMGGPVTFCLTSGGHNAGIACGPEHPRRRYRLSTFNADDNFVARDDWFEATEVTQGSWWPAWNQWLDQRISGSRKPPAMGATKKGYKPLQDAPGQYVFG